MDFLFSKAAIYAKLKQPVKYILDVMELDVPNLFTDSKSGTGGISVPGKNFKELLHSYIASNGLQRELLKKVDVIMVSLCLMLLWCYNYTCMHKVSFEASVSDSHTCGENDDCVYIFVCTYIICYMSIYISTLFMCDQKFSFWNADHSWL